MVYILEGSAPVSVAVRVQGKPLGGHSIHPPAFVVEKSNIVIRSAGQVSLGQLRQVTSPFWVSVSLSVK